MPDTNSAMVEARLVLFGASVGPERIARNPLFGVGVPFGVSTPRGEPTNRHRVVNTGVPSVWQHRTFFTRSVIVRRRFSSPGNAHPTPVARIPGS